MSKTENDTTTPTIAAIRAAACHTLRAIRAARDTAAQCYPHTYRAQYRLNNGNVFAAATMCDSMAALYLRGGNIPEALSYAHAAVLLTKLAHRVTSYGVK